MAKINLDSKTISIQSETPTEIELIRTLFYILTDITELEVDYNVYNGSNEIIIKEWE